MNYYLILNPGTFEKMPQLTSYPYHMALCQSATKSSDYLDGLIDVRRQGGRLILDNGAHEGHIVGWEEYLSIIDRVRPSVIILPDLIGYSHQQSREYSLTFMRKLTDRLYKSIDRRYTPEFMYVPQGRDTVEVLSEFQWAVDTLTTGEFIIGFGQSYLAWCMSADGETIDPNKADSEGGRASQITAVINRLRWSSPGYTTPRFHVLGARWEPGPFARVNRPLYARFVGVDSIKPLHCALSQCLYPARPESARMPVQSYGSDTGRKVRLTDDCPTWEALDSNVMALCHWYVCSNIWRQTFRDDGTLRSVAGDQDDVATSDEGHRGVVE